MNLELAGKTALVTGGTHGIGLAICKSLAHEGCTVIACSRSAKKISESVEKLCSNGVAHYGYEFDALSRESVENLVVELRDQFPSGIDVLINNVGGGGRWGSSEFIDNEMKVWDEVYQKNVGVAIQLTRAFLPNMIKKGWGRVVGITSIYGRMAGGRPWFNIAKSAQTAFFKNLSQDRNLIRSGVTFNTVAPGAIEITETGWDVNQWESPEVFNSYVEERFPLGRLGRPDEVASVVTFLCSTKASFVNGASILVDGGECPVI